MADQRTFAEAMFSIANLVAWVAIVSFTVAVATGAVASAHVDKEKKEKAEGRIQKWGPLVAESILSDEGLKWARIRNISLACFGAVAVIYAVVMGLLEK